MKNIIKDRHFCYQKMNILIPAIVIHGYEDAQTAAMVSHSVQCPLILISAPGASAYNGVS